MVGTRRGSWPALLALAAAFVLLFYWQRSRSTFLQIEQERPVAARMAPLFGVEVADVLALRDMAGLHAPEGVWYRLVGLYAAEVKTVRAAGPVGAPVVIDREHASFAASRVAPDDLAARRFLLLRERFAARR